MYRHRSVLNRNPGFFRDNSEFRIGSSFDGSPINLHQDFFRNHTLITGRTGSGKSNFLKVLLTALPTESNTLTVVIDPHGDTARHAMAYFGDRTLMLALGTAERDGVDYSLKMNPLSTPGVKSAVTAGMLKEVFSSIEEFSSGTWGPRLELILGTVMQHLAENNENANLGDLADLLMSQQKMRAFISTIGDEKLSSYMKMQMSDWRGWNSFVSSSLNKIIPLISNPLTSDLVGGRKDSFDLEGMAERTMLIVPEIWNSSMPGGTAAILSSMVLVKIWAFSIGSFLRGKHNRIRIIVDEAQLIPANILMRLLTEGRKYGISLIMATQQVPIDSYSWKNILLGNVGNFVCFSSADANASLISAASFSGPQYSQVRDSIISLEPHRCILWSKLPESMAGPVTCEVRLTDQHSTGDEEFRYVSITRFGSPRVIEGRPDYIDLHESLIGSFSTFLEKKGIALYRDSRINGKIPDGTFIISGTEYILEVEVSDLSNFSRIVEKIMHYWDRKKIFLTPEGFGPTLFNSIIEHVSAFPERDKEGIQRYLRSISLTTVCEFDQRPRIVLSNGRMLLNISNLQDGSFMTSLKRSVKGGLLVLLFQHFMDTGIYRISNGSINELFFSGSNAGGKIDIDFFKTDEVTCKGLFDLCRA